MTEIHYFPVCEVELGFFFSPKVTIYSAHRDTSIAHGYMVRRDLERPGTGVEVEWDSGQWADYGRFSMGARGVLVRMVPGWPRTPKRAPSTALFEIRRLRMVSWSARTRNVSEYLMKCDRWQGGAKVEYGARRAHLSHFMRYSESFLIRADCDTMLNRRISSRAVDWACFGDPDHSGTILKTPGPNTPCPMLDPPLVTSLSLMRPGHLRVFCNVPETCRTWNHAQSTCHDEICRLAVCFDIKKFMFIFKSPNIWNFLVPRSQKML